MSPSIDLRGGPSLDHPTPKSASGMCSRFHLHVSIGEVSGRSLGGIWEASGRHWGRFWEASGTSLGGIGWVFRGHRRALWEGLWEASERPLEAFGQNSES